MLPHPGVIDPNVSRNFKMKVLKNQERLDATISWYWWPSPKLPEVPWTHCYVIPAKTVQWTLELPYSTQSFKSSLNKVISTYSTLSQSVFENLIRQYLSDDFTSHDPLQFTYHFWFSNFDASTSFRLKIAPSLGKKSQCFWVWFLVYTMMHSMMLSESSSAKTPQTTMFRTQPFGFYYVICRIGSRLHSRCSTRFNCVSVSIPELHFSDPVISIFLP